jgi:hypothetical protein
MSAASTSTSPTSTQRWPRVIRTLALPAILLAVLIAVVPWVVTASSAGSSLSWFSPLLISVILLAALIAAAPLIVARTGLRDRAINRILASPSVTASSAGASLGWFSPLSIRGLRLTSTNGHVEIRVAGITAERSPWQLWRSVPDLGTIRAVKPHVILEWPLDVPIRGLQTRPEPTVAAVVEDAALTIRRAGQDEPAVDVDGINMTFRVEKAGEGRVLTLDPVVVFDRRKLSPKLSGRLLHLFDPTMSDTPDVNGEFSLLLDKVHIPVGIPRDEAVRQMEVEGKLVLHQVSSRVKSPLRQALVRLVADLNGKPAPEVARFVLNVEIRFRVRDGRLHHDGLRIGLPDIDPALHITSRGSVGLDRTVDLFVELPRLDRARWQGKGPARCRVTGTVDHPSLAVEDGTLTLRQPGRTDPIFAAEGIDLTMQVEDTGTGRVLAVAPVEVFRRTKLSLGVASGLLKLLAPDVAAPERQVAGEISLSLSRLRMPFGVAGDQMFKHLEAEGKVTLHQVASDVKSPMWRALIRVVADMNGTRPADVIRLVADAEVPFRVRDGRLHHEGLRIGFPDIDPALVVRSRGSVGLDETLDLFLELPRLDKVLREEKSPARCHITGTSDNPRIAVADGTLVLRQQGRKDPILAADGIDLNIQIETTPAGRVLAVEPVQIFRKTKLNLGVVSGLLKFLAPDVADTERQVDGAISLSLSRLRLPLGIAGGHEFEHLEAEGRLTLHEVASEVRSPMWQALIRLLSRINGGQQSDVIRLVAESEIHFLARDGRFYHDGHRIGFPEIDPALVISSRGWIGIDETLDLYLEVPRLRKTKRDNLPIRCLVTGTIREPIISVQNAPLLVRWGMTRGVQSVYAWACRSPLLTGSLSRASRWASIGLRRVADLSARLLPSHRSVLESPRAVR